MELFHVETPLTEVDKEEERDSKENVADVGVNVIKIHHVTKWTSTAVIVVAKIIIPSAVKDLRGGNSKVINLKMKNSI